MHTKFLKPFSRKEAFAKGIAFENKLKHEVLSYIDGNSSLKRAKNKELAETGGIYAAFANKVSEPGIDKLLIELKLDNMFSILPGIEFDLADKVLSPVFYLVSMADSRSVDLHDIYDAILDQSIEELNIYMDTIEWFDRDAIWKDLDTSLMEDSNTDVFYPNICFDIKNIFREVKLPVSIDPGILREFREDLSDKIIERRLGIEVGKDAVFLFTDANLNELAQVLSAFFRNRIIPTYEDVPEIQRELELIDKQEELYEFTPRAPRTFSYTEARASVVYKYLKNDVYPNQELFPGRLPLVMIGKLVDKINETYEKERISEVYAQYNELKKNLFSPKASWRELLLFITDEDLEPYHKESVDKLINDKDVLHCNWYMKDDNYHVFIGLDIENFYTVIEGMRNLKNNESWKVLAFRSVLENSNRIKPEINPFYDLSFHTRYGKLLKAAYSAHMPFMFNFLLSFKIKFIDNLIYKNVKRKVAESQTYFRAKFEDNKSDLKNYFNKEVTARQAFIKKLAVRNRILEELDFFYFQQATVPSVNDVAARFPNINESAFRQLLKDFNFELISVEGESWKNKIVFYPKSAAWKQLTSKTAKKINEQIENHRNIAKYGNEDRILLKRLKAVKNLIQIETG